MNAPHPIRALHGHLVTLAPSLDAIEVPDPAAAYDRAHAAGELGTALTMLDHAVSALTMGAWHLDRAIRKGAGHDVDAAELGRLRIRLAAAATSVEASAAHLSDTLAGAR